MPRVAVDAMGGDHAPHEVIYGAIAALEDAPDLEVILCGPSGPICDALRPQGPMAGSEGSETLPLPARMRISEAADWIRMDENPVEALRRKPDCSVLRGLALCQQGEADAFFSAGHTGAACAAASMTLRRVEGVRRPAIAVCLPTPRGPVTLIDAGANLTPRPIDLVQYAVMGTVYQREVLGIERPTVGLLSIGSETGKGGALVREAAPLCAAALGDRFHGPVEGHDIVRGTTSVVVCDAITGNAVLKVIEGVGETLLGQLREILQRTFRSGSDRHRLEWALRDLTEHMDYAEYGGAPLLGADGVVIVGHGRSEGRAIANGIRLAARAASGPFRPQLRRALEELPSLATLESAAGGTP